MRRRLLILLASLMLAGISGLAVLAYARSVDRQAIAGKEGVWVLLATDRIPARTTAAAVRDGKLAHRVLMPARTVPTGALDSIDASLNTLRLTADLQPQQLLMRGQFSDTTDTQHELGIPTGKLAVSVQLTIAPQVGGNVMPGDEVTVFDTYPATPGGEQKQVTRILLPRVTVIGVGPKETEDSDAATALSATADGQSLVTFAVNQRDAERLVHASRTGLLYLGLLTDSTKVTPGPGIDNERLFS